MSDPADVGLAIVAALKVDTGTGGLMTLMTDGVWIDIAPHGCTKFVIVSQATHRDEYVFDGPAFEESEYLVKAVDLNTSRTRVRAAGARIHALLQDAALNISGYALMVLQRKQYVGYPDPDQENKDIVWQHCGGRYEVFVSPT